MAERSETMYSCPGDLPASFMVDWKRKKKKITVKTDDISASVCQKACGRIWNKAEIVFGTEREREREKNELFLSYHTKCYVWCKANSVMSS